MFKLEMSEPNLFGTFRWKRFSVTVRQWQCAHLFVGEVHAPKTRDENRRNSEGGRGMVGNGWGLLPPSKIMGIRL